MGKKSGTKKLRGSRGSKVGVRKDHCDLMVPLPKGLSKLESELLVKELAHRLSATGFTRVALTHTIYGRPKPEDRAAVAIPDSLMAAAAPSLSSVEQATDQPALSKKRRRNDFPAPTTGDGSTELCLLRRLHVVLEHQSDVGWYAAHGPHESLLNQYDIVSVGPTNDVTFQSACSSATMADVISLEYYNGSGLRLPYKIRPTDVKAAIDKGTAFEIPVAPALLHLKHRKALVRACTELRSASLGSKPCIAVSSGSRTLEGKDVGALALRRPGDLSNLVKTVLGFDDATANAAVSAAPLKVIQRGRERRSGTRGIPSVRVYTMQKADLEASSERGKAVDHLSTEAEGSNDAEPEVDDSESSRSRESDDDDSNDGFMAL